MCRAILGEVERFSSWGPSLPILLKTEGEVEVEVAEHLEIGSYI